MSLSMSGAVTRHSGGNDARRAAYLADRTNLRVICRNRPSNPTPLRKKFALKHRTPRSDPNPFQQDFFPTPDDFNTIVQQSQATIAAFIQNLEELPIHKNLPPERGEESSDARATLPPPGTDMDFSLIQTEVKGRVRRHNINVRPERVLKAGTHRQHRRTFLYRAPLVEEIFTAKRWSPVVEENYRFQRAGYPDETHFRAMHGWNVQSKRATHPKTQKSASIIPVFFHSGKI